MKTLMRIPDISKGDFVALLELRMCSVQLVKRSVIRVAKNWITVEHGIRVHRVTGKILKESDRPNQHLGYAFLGVWGPEHTKIAQHMHVEETIRNIDRARKHPVLSEIAMSVVSKALDAVQQTLQRMIETSLKQKQKERRATRRR